MFSEHCKLGSMTNSWFSRCNSPSQKRFWRIIVPYDIIWCMTKSFYTIGYRLGQFVSFPFRAIYRLTSFICNTIYIVAYSAGEAIQQFFKGLSDGVSFDRVLNFCTKIYNLFISIIEFLFNIAEFLYSFNISGIIGTIILGVWFFAFVFSLLYK